MLFWNEDKNTDADNPSKDQNQKILRLNLCGDWTVTNYVEISRALKKQRHRAPTSIVLNIDSIQQIDTAGVLLMADSFGVSVVEQALASSRSSKERKAMISTVLQSIPSNEDRQAHKKPSRLLVFVSRIGQAIDNLWTELLRWMGFLGMVLAAFFRTLFNPKEWRTTSLMANIDSSGLQAVPIVMLLCFMVGAVVAFLGATVLETFGAQIFTVHLVTYSFLREFAIILTSILIAGRTASAYTAQLGSMKINEEIDALYTSGTDPLTILVVPRVLALVIALPILTFLGMLAGILGGMLVSALAMDISPRLFFDIMNESIHVKHFLVGIGKAPIFAVVIAITGCLEGFKVSGSAESVGEHTTASVVKCIFLVILLDALFAIFFMEMGW